MSDNQDLLADMRREFIDAANQFPHSWHQFIEIDVEKLEKFPSWMGEKLMEPMWYANRKKFSLMSVGEERQLFSRLARRAAVYANTPGLDNGKETDLWLEFVYATLERERPNLVHRGYSFFMPSRQLKIDPFTASALTINIIVPNLTSQDGDPNLAEWLTPGEQLATVKLGNMDEAKKRKKVARLVSALPETDKSKRGNQTVVRLSAWRALIAAVKNASNSADDWSDAVDEVAEQEAQRERQTAIREEKTRANR